MDVNRFDRLTKTFASTRSRRGAAPLVASLTRTFARTATRRGMLAAATGIALAALGRHPDRVVLAKPAGRGLSAADKRCRELETLRGQAIRLKGAAENKVTKLKEEEAKIQQRIASIQFWLNSTPPDDPRYQELQKDLAKANADLVKNQSDQSFYQQQVDIYQQELDKIQKEFTDLNCYCRLRVESAGGGRRAAAQKKSKQPVCCANGAQPVGKKQCCVATDSPCPCNSEGACDECCGGWCTGTSNKCCIGPGEPCPGGCEPGKECTLGCCSAWCNNDGTCF